MPRKVLQIVPRIAIGGREKVVFSLMTGLDRGRFDATLLTLRQSSVPEGYFTSRGVRCHCLGSRGDGFDLPLVARLRRYLAEQRFDIVHTHNPGAFIYGAVAARLAGVPVIVNTEHGYSRAISARKRLVENLLRNRISLTIAVSRQLRADLCRGRGVDAARIEVVHNGIDVGRFRDVLPAAGACPDVAGSGELVVGTIGRLDPVKAHAVLLEAVALCARQSGRIRLVVVGDGPERHRLAATAAALGIGDRVVLAGFRPDVPQLLALMDIFVLPSLSEGLSVTLMEAMAAGKPIIATRVGGNPELIEDRVCGILVPPGSPGSLAAAILELARQPELGRRLGAAAARRAADEFSEEAFVRNVESIYLRLAGGGGAAS